MTTHRPADRTPAGAYLNVRRRSRWSSVQIDRWPMTDATPQQANTATALARAAARRCSELGKRGGIGLGDGRVIWTATVPTTELDQALAALLALEAGDHQPAHDLTRRYLGACGATGASDTADAPTCLAEQQATA